MGDRKSEHGSMQELKNAISRIGDTMKPVPVRESEEDPKHAAAGAISACIYQGLKLNEYIDPPDGIDTRFGDDGSLHITVSFRPGAWEEAQNR